MYESAAAISRPEISAFLEEASDDPGLVAAKLLPIYTSAARAGRYPRIRIGAGALLKNYSTKRGTTGTYNEVARAFEWDTFDCVDYGLIERVDDVVSREMSNFFDVEVYTAKFVREELELDYEIRTAGLIFNANTFTVQNSSAAYTIANLATFNFPTDLNGIMYTLKLRRYAPNTIWMNRAVWNRIRASTFLQNYLYGNIGAGTQFRSIAPSDIGAAFGIPNVLICDASVDPTPLNKANAGANAQAISLAALAPVWSSAYIGVGKVAGGDFKAGGMGRTISWGADVQGGMFITETYRDENRRGNTIRVRMNTAEKVIDLNACVLLGTQYS